MPLLLLVLVAAVQGLTEFLPVSSSGHLALIPLVTDQPYQGRAIDVAAHVGTLGAVLLYFRRDLIAMLLALRPGNASQAVADQRQMIRLLIMHCAVPSRGGASDQAAALRLRMSMQENREFLARPEAGRCALAHALTAPTCSPPRRSRASEDGGGQAFRGA